MQSKFREIARVYKDFKRHEAKLTEELNAELASGENSTSKNVRLQREHKATINQERTNIAHRLDIIKSDIISMLDKEYSFEDKTFSLVGITNLKSYIDNFELSPREWEQTATRHKDNIALSRYINERAKQAGYQLNNYISYEQALQELDNLLHRTITAVNADNAMLSPYVDINDCDVDCGQTYGRIANHDNIVCLPIAKDLETAISNEQIIQANTPEAKAQAEAHGKAFIEGLTGQAPAEPQPQDLLTDQERQDAKKYNIMKGGKGEISQDDVTWIRSHGYTEILEQRKAQEQPTEQPEGTN